jgi:type IV pilus assembly protein PilN
MIRINLLPFRAKRKKENIRRQVFMFLSLLVLIALALFYYNMILNNNIAELEDKVSRTRQELVVTQKKAKQVDRIKKQIETLQKKMDIIAQLEKDRLAPVEFLSGLSSVIIEKKMWLTGLTSEDTTVQLSGIALDNKTVAQFMTNLEKSPLYSTVNLKTLRHTEMQNISLKAFDMICVKAPPQ